jgi:anti-sigma B factor antagonist
MARALQIGEFQDGGRYVLSVSGRLDTNTAPQLEAVANRINLENGAADIVVDMKDCSFLSSAGLRVIITMQKRSTMGGSLRFCNVTPQVMEVFSATGFDQILTFE